MFCSFYPYILDFNFEKNQRNPKNFSIVYNIFQGYIVSFMVDSATGRLTKGRRLEIQPSVRCQGPLVTSISFTAWSGRGGRDPSLLVSCTANALFLYKYKQTPQN